MGEIGHFRVKNVNINPIRKLYLPHGELDLPTFLPDATRGVVRSVDANDVINSGIQALVMNTYHLMQHPGSSTVQALKGLHKMTGWEGPIVTDSGGFQAYSLIRQYPKRGTVTSKGFKFSPEGSDRNILLTPEKTVQLQLSYDTDVVICLDDCTHPDDPIDRQREAVMRTVEWAQRCKNEYKRIVEQKEYPRKKIPLIFAVIQGGRSRELRKFCASELLEIGFDGYGYGGWPLDEGGNLLNDIFYYIRELVPPEFPLHALGVGHPENILVTAGLGYSLFDSALPTRDARKGRLYSFTINPSSKELTEKWFSYVYIQDNKHVKNNLPVSLYCDCLLCTNYSIGYLHHLYKINDCLYQRLATIHNLRFISQLMDHLRSKQC